MSVPFSICSLLCIPNFSTVWGQSLTDDADASSIASLVASLEGSKLDIHRASRSDLAAFPLFGAETVDRLIAYRESGKQITDLDDLRAILGIDQETAESLAPYIRLSPPPRYIQTHTQVRATTKSRSLDRARVLSRVSLATRRWHASIVTERDPGESALADHASGFISGHLGGSSTITLGDLRPGWGTGLLLARQTRSAMSSPPSRIRSSSKLGTTSSEESGALRVGALRTQRSWGSLLGILGRTLWDAKVEDGIATLRTSGDHASESGKLARNTLSERTQLLCLNIVSRLISIGATYSRSQFDHELRVGPTLGRSHQHLSLTGSLDTRRLRLFAETSKASVSGDNRGWATQIGIRTLWGRHRLLVTGRHIAPAYVAIRSAPAVAYEGRNERGIGILASIRWTRTTLDVFLDRHTSIERPAEWSKRRAGSRSNLSVYHKLTSTLTAEIRVAGLRENQAGQNQGPRSRSAVRFRLKGSRHRQGLSVWAERVTASSQQSDFAWAVGTDLRLRLPHLRIDLWVTKTERTGSPARIYAFRPGVWGGRSVIALPADGTLASARVVLHGGPLELAATYHYAASPGVGLQLSLKN